MFTDRAPLKARYLAEFLESDRLGSVNLPQDERLRRLGKSIESAVNRPCKADGITARSAPHHCIRHGFGVDCRRGRSVEPPHSPKLGEPLST